MSKYNEREVCDGTMAYLANPDITVKELMEHIPAPDMPTGELICGLPGLKRL
ncbi:MAG: hypothetical protein IPL25_20265 [Saprospiraceae bacterium]|nr:hypothetical protein [Candidatus Vicinibacter affinis]